MFFFFNDTATTEIYTLSLHDALPISDRICEPRIGDVHPRPHDVCGARTKLREGRDDDLAAASRLDLGVGDRKSTRLNSSHANISYAVFCLKKKKTTSRILSRYEIST